IGALRGVLHAQANPASGSVSVHYDAAVASEAALRQAVRDCGYHCRGEMQPDHVCKPEEPDAHPGHGAQPVTKDKMAHEMGHGAGMDMAGMVRDMRNRFIVCLAFSLLLFFWAPMGLPLPTPAVPFGLELDQWLFLLAQECSSSERFRCCLSPSCPATGSRCGLAQGRMTRSVRSSTSRRRWPASC